jgi:hypothetical protein
MLDQSIALSNKEEILALASVFTEDILRNKEHLNPKFDLRIFKNAKNIIDMIINEENRKILGNNLDNIIRSDEKKRKSLETLQYGWILLFHKMIEREDMKEKAEQYMKFSRKKDNPNSLETLSSFDDFIRWFVQ